MQKDKAWFSEFVSEVKTKSFYKEPLIWAFGRVEKGVLEPDKTLSVSYAVVNFKENFGSVAVMLWALNECGIRLDTTKSEAVIELTKEVTTKALSCFEPFKDEIEKHRNFANLALIDELLDDPKNRFCVTFIFEDEKPKSVEAIYLKLYSLSLGKAPLRSLNLDDIFITLPNLAWTKEQKPVELEWLRQNEMRLKMMGEYPVIKSVDKIPLFLSHIIPDDSVKITDTTKVRVGAFLANGTTIMPGASYVNFNSGTIGTAMIEGRVSSSAIVSEGSDIGGGASILGVLSGTSGNPITIGKKCLLGANSVAGISLGDGCIIDGGLAILEGMKVFIDDENKKLLLEENPEFKFNKDIYKAKELEGLNKLHFRRDSQTGQVKATFASKKIKLNKDLH
ncbi:MAG: 2,3,4,5-tetrahydropyridine-2,6-carboxylate N-succinyltransferase [Campylobacteraceae bacterium]|nr:2,3,4,5-tetrahydropyridine-2,6-carboxylate N-succinyltransferase [Campylobacteraceae bacterium]